VTSGLAGDEHQCSGPDVRVTADLVRVSVVAVVLVHPPSIAQSDREVAVQQAEDVAGATGPEDLLVASVVAEEGHLGERNAQNDGRRQLPPGPPDRYERRPSRRQ
jgi:hypothetical protein